MHPGLECDVKKDVHPNMTSACWSPVACVLFFFVCFFRVFFVFVFFFFGCCCFFGSVSISETIQINECIHMHYQYL